MVKVDGRTTRGQANKKLIVKALLALIREGHVAPTAEMVSERAGVGLRTVFRHFKAMETLYREITTEVDEIMAPVLATSLQGDSWQEKLMHAIERRADMFEQLAPIQAANLIHLHESEFLRDRQEKSVALQRMLLQAFLPEHVMRDQSMFETLDLLLSIESWLRLRREQKLSVEQAKTVLRDAITHLISRY